jgi:hypothetical protein
MKNTRFGIVTQIANGVAAAFITIAYGGVVIFRLIEEFNPFALQGSLKDLMPSLIKIDNSSQGFNQTVPENWSGSFYCSEDDHSNCDALNLCCTKVSYMLQSEKTEFSICGK